ncbi:phage tail protein [Shigella flexneri]
MYQPGQAHRAGLRLIKRNCWKRRPWTSSVGAEGLRHVPGDVIETAMMIMPVSAPVVAYWR